MKTRLFYVSSEKLTNSHFPVSWDGETVFVRMEDAPPDISDVEALDLQRSYTDEVFLNAVEI